MLVKICGIRTKEAALQATKTGADFLGFNFVPSSNRKISLNKARQIISALPNKKPKIVGIFQNQPFNFVKQTAEKLKLDYIQLHGEEDVKFCKKLHGFKIIKSISLPSDFNTRLAIKIMSPYKNYVDYFLLDRINRGSGRALATLKVKSLTLKHPIILAGGLTPKNIKIAIKGLINLKAVDVAGGVEVKGKQDNKMIKMFINNVKMKKAHK